MRQYGIYKVRLPYEILSSTNNKAQFNQNFNYLFVEKSLKSK
jgi:hypothetical protein